MPAIADRLIDLRKQKGVTQKQVYTAIGIGERNYQSFEYGTVKPSYDNLIKLADYFDVSIDYLVGRSNNPIKN